jgi:hypothetical protein
MEDLEEWLGEDALKRRWRWWADRMVGAAEEYYWDPQRELYADDLEKRRYSQHAQVLAIMTGLIAGDRGEGLCRQLLTDGSLTQCNIYFSHYLLDVLSAFGHIEPVRQRYAAWSDLIERGCTTFPEHFDGARSECHAWSSHPLCHYIRHVLGYATAGWGGDEVVFEPTLREGETIRIRVAHRRGMVDVDLRCQGGKVSGQIETPGQVRCRAPAGVQVRQKA